MSTNGQGFSLLELIVCLSISVVLFASVVGPSFSVWRYSLEIEGVIQDFMAALSLARNHAVAGNVTVTLCRSSDGLRCLGDWNNGLIVFTDINADRVVNGGDRLVHRVVLFKPVGSISFNSFQNRQYLQFTPRGFTRFQNGNFTLCANSGDARHNRQIIISLSGRARYATDSNGDGVVEDSQGFSVNCGV